MSPLGVAFAHRRRGRTEVEGVMCCGEENGEDGARHSERSLTETCERPADPRAGKRAA
jgi:hypothetical protein